MSSRPFARAAMAIALTGIAAIAPENAQAQRTRAVAEGVEETWDEPPREPVEATFVERGRALPPLEEVVEKALTFAPDVRSGRAAVEVSRASRVNARRAPMYNPHFEVQAERSRNGATQGTPWTATFWLPFEISGTRNRRMKEADAYVHMHDLGVEVAQATAAGEAIAAYGRVLVAAERVRVLERLLVVAREAARIYEARMEVGDAILRDVTMARMDLGRTQALLAEAQGQFASALSDLLRLTGERYDRVETHAILPPELDLEAFVAKVDERLAPSVAALEAQGQFYHEQKVRLAREAVPAASLMIIGGQGDAGDGRFGLGLAYEIPVIRSNQGERAFAEAESQRAQIEGDIRASVIRARLEGILEQLRREKEAYDVLTTVALPAADEAVEAAVATAAGGKEDAFVVIVSRRERVLLALQRLEVVERQWSLLGELVQLTGEMP